MAALSTLERKIDRHMKESSEQIKLLKTDLQHLKDVSKSKIQKASPGATERILKDRLAETKFKVPAKAASRDVRKISVSIQRTSLKQFYAMQNDFQLSQQRSSNDESKMRSRAPKQLTSFSEVTERSESSSVISRIEFNGSLTKLNCNPLKLIRFFTMELKSKLEVLVPAGKLRLA